MSKPTSLRELFSDERKWTKGTYARNAFGLPVSFDDPGAVCFCLIGGFEFVYGQGREPEKWKALCEEISYRAAGSDVTPSKFNDKFATINTIQSLCKALNL